MSHKIHAPGTQPVVEFVDPKDEAAFDEWFSVMSRSAREGRHAPLVWERDDLLEDLTTPSSSHESLVLAASVAGKVVGTAMIELPLREELSVAEVDVEVDPAWRRQGIGSALLAAVLRETGARDRTELRAEVNVPPNSSETWPGRAFAHHHGFQKMHEEDHLALSLPFPQAALAALSTDAAVRAGYRIMTWQGATPPQTVEDYAVLRRGMSLEVPSGQIEREAEAWDASRIKELDELAAKQGRLLLVATAMEPGGHLVGHSQLVVPISEDGHVYQEDTYVLEAHRGHGLGRSLKVANLAQLADAAPAGRWIHTWTAGANTAMNTLNSRIGFSPVETTEEFVREGR